MTGIMDHLVLSGQVNELQADTFGIVNITNNTYLKGWLADLKQVAIDTNIEWAGYLGIEPSKHITLIKPSGTVSQLCGTSSGIHPRFSPYYFRRFTQDEKDPLTQLMIDQGIPHVKRKEKVIFSFPIKSPEGAVCARDMGAIEQLELWKIYREHWCDGNPSQTIYYTDDTFLDVQAWVFKNWDIIGGLSFFPLDDYIYDKETQPFLEVTEDGYKEAISTFPSMIEWDKLQDYESEDGTMSEVELACSGVGGCELL